MALVLLQIGLIAKDQLLVEDAARAGARQAAVTTDDASARQAATDAASGLDPSLLEVDVARSGGAGSAVKVTVIYHAPVAVPIVRWLLPTTIDLSGAATMRQETG